MKKWLIVASLGLATLLLAFAWILFRWPPDPNPVADPASTPAPAAVPSVAEASTERSQAFLYGRVTTAAGEEYEGRLRFGTDEEAYWDEFFNGYKASNPWAEFVPPEHLKERVPIEIFGFQIASRTRQIDLDRPFMVRLGDVARIDVDGRDLRVTLRNGHVFDLDRFHADDVADGLRVWDAKRGVVDLVEWRIRSVEFLQAPLDFQATTDSRPGFDDFPPSGPLSGVVTTRDGRRLVGRLVYDLDESDTAETLDAPSGEVNHSVPFGKIASIELGDDEERIRVVLQDGSELLLEREGDLGDGNAGLLVFVDGLEQPEYAPWSGVRRIDFHAPSEG